MSNNVKDIAIKSHTYYCFHDVINTKNFDPNNIKIDEKAYKNILIYYIGYVKTKSNLAMEKSRPTFTITKYQKKILIVFAYQ